MSKLERARSFAKSLRKDGLTGVQIKDSLKKEGFNVRQGWVKAGFCLHSEGGEVEIVCDKVNGSQSWDMLIKVMISPDSDEHPDGEPWILENKEEYISYGMLRDQLSVVIRSIETLLDRGDMRWDISVHKNYVDPLSAEDCFCIIDRYNFR